MTLRHKILLKMGALLGGFALLGLFAIWGFASLRANNHAAQREFHELREIRSIGVKLAADKAMLQDGPARRPALVGDLRSVVGDLEKFLAEQTAEEVDETSEAENAHDAQKQAHARQAMASVNEMLKLLAAPDAAVAGEEIRISRLHDSALVELDGVADECSKFLASVHAITRTKVVAVLIAMSVLSGVILASTIAVGISLYRSVVIPLHQLNAGVLEIKAGHFSRRLPETGDPEFVAVIHEFNQMAAQLEGFYHRLEEQVAQKSRELVRSERLASVGFLAAGVAHEIRNPLGIISGYAELALKILANSDALRAATKEGRILGVIRDEAFRCKQITDKLLGLVQGGGEGREPVDLARIVRDGVAFLVKGLESFRDRQAVLSSRVPDSLCVSANPIEMKQVVLNLTLNALDAVETGNGKIEVEGRQVDGRVELSVRDNGCGMTPQIMERVFEPFYTTRRGKAAPGTGLGLSISHAIITGYGGTLRADSEGPGRGSRFTIDLPAMQEAMP